MGKSIKITAVGDLFLGEHPVTLGHGVDSVVQQNGPGFLFESIGHLIGEADITYGNLEGIISPKLDSENSIRQKIFWGDPSCARAMKEVGFNCLSLANNHTAQHGTAALLRTCQLLDRHQIQWTGFDTAEMGASKPARFEIRGTSISFLAYCDTQQYHLDEKILPVINLDQMITDIRQEKQHCEFLVLCLHWGDEFIDYPSTQQISVARALVDAGANLILGSHSHRIQGIQTYNNALIVYSLGSFIKDLWPKKLRKSLILSLMIDQGAIKDYTVTPIWITREHRPEVWTGKSAQQFLNQFDQLCRNLDNLNPTETQAWQQAYEKDVEKLLLQDRISTVFYYLTHLHRYNKRLLAQNMQLMVRRRLYGKNI